MKPVQSPIPVSSSCSFPVMHEQGECPLCSDNWGECPECGSLLHYSCLEEVEEFLPDAEEESAYAAWAEELLREGEEEGKWVVPLLKSIPVEEFAPFAGPCPDTATLVAYQESGFLSSYLDRHVLFCRSCLEEFRILGRADKVEYEYPT